MTKVEIRYYDFLPGNEPGNYGWTETFVVEDDDKAWHQIINNCGGAFQAHWKEQLLEVPEINGNTILLIFNSYGGAINQYAVEHQVFLDVPYTHYKSVSGLTIPYTGR